MRTELREARRRRCYRCRPPPLLRSAVAAAAASAVRRRRRHCRRQSADEWPRLAPPRRSRACGGHQPSGARGPERRRRRGQHARRVAHALQRAAQRARQAGADEDREPTHACGAPPSCLSLPPLTPRGGRSYSAHADRAALGAASAAPDQAAARLCAIVAATGRPSAVGFRLWLWLKAVGCRLQVAGC